MENSGITWTTHTFNPVMGCVRVSPACQLCYAETLVTGRMGKDVWGVNKPRTKTSDNYWKQPLRWQKEAAESGKQVRVFCASLSDVFEDHPDWVQPRKQLWQLIADTPDLQWLLLTKRPENFTRMNPNGPNKPWPGNVWLGTTVETQEYAYRRIPYLAEQSGTAINFVSVEPQLGPITLKKHLPGDLDWVIVGGESGSGARRSDLSWWRSLRDECAGHAYYFVKQMGVVLAKELGLKDKRHGADISEFPEDLRIQEIPFLEKNVVGA